MTPPTRQDRGPTLAALLAIVIIAAAIAGLRAPWLRPLADELSEQLAMLSREIDDYQVPGDGLPTLERMAQIMAQLDQLSGTAMHQTTGDDQAVLLHQYRNIWPSAIALNDRVQRSHAQPIQEL